MTELTIEYAIKAYIDAITLSRSENTARTYRNGIKLFSRVLEVRNLPIKSTNIQELPEDAVAWFSWRRRGWKPSAGSAGIRLQPGASRTGLPRRSSVSPTGRSSRRRHPVLSCCEFSLVRDDRSLKRASTVPVRPGRYK